MTRLSLPTSRHCEGCPGAEEEGPHHPTLELTTSCPYKCPHCYARYAEGKGVTVKPGLYGEPRGCLTVSQYGEPTVLGGELIDILETVREAGLFDRIDLQTRGYRPDLAPRLSEICDLVMVSIDVTNPDAHRRLHGVGPERTLRFAASVDRPVIRSLYLPGINDDLPRELADTEVEPLEVFVQPLIPFGRAAESLKRIGLRDHYNVVGSLLDWAEKFEEFGFDVRFPACWVDSLNRLKVRMEKELGFTDIRNVRYSPNPGTPAPERRFTPLRELLDELVR
ncbi:radical SAM protein [Methanopyrus sp.]